MSCKRNIVISADHRGSCIMAINYDDESSFIEITIDDVIRDVNSRPEIVKEIEMMVKTQYKLDAISTTSFWVNTCKSFYSQKKSGAINIEKAMISYQKTRRKPFTNYGAP
jgi:hypothetical protein